MHRRHRKYDSPQFAVFPAIIVLFILIGLVVMQDGTLSAGTQKKVTDQSYTARSGVSFTYPSNWYIVESEGTTTIATNPDGAYTTEMGPDDFSITILPPYPAQLLDDSGMSLSDAISETAHARYVDYALGPAEDTHVGEMSAIRATLNGPSFDGFALGLALPDDYFVLVYVQSAPGMLPQYENTMLAILQSIRFEPPAAPTPEPAVPATNG